MVSWMRKTRQIRKIRHHVLDAVTFDTPFLLIESDTGVGHAF